MLLMDSTERKVREAFGSITQLATNWSIDVPQQFPGVQSGEIDGSEIDCRPAHQYHFLPYEGNDDPLERREVTRQPTRLSC